MGGENWKSAVVPFRVEVGIDILESYIREVLARKLITQAGPWYTYGEEKAMGMNGIKEFFLTNTDAYTKLQNEFTA